MRWFTVNLIRETATMGKGEKFSYGKVLRDVFGECFLIFVYSARGSASAREPGCPLNHYVSFRQAI